MIRQWVQWMNIRRLVVALLFIGLVVMAIHPPLDADTGWHLQAGRVTVESGHILQTDVFSHTRYGSRWTNHSWLAQVVLYWIFETFSYPGLGLWVCAMVTAAFALVFLQMEGDPFSRAFITVLAAVTSGVIWTPRPQLFSFLFTAFVAYILYLLKWRGINRLWALPPLFVLWVNLHAGYALGFMLLAAFVAGEILNHLLAYIAPSADPALDWRTLGLVVGVTLLSAMLLVINPNTTRMWTYYLDTVRIQFLRAYIQEWRSPDFHLLGLQPFIWLLLLILASMGLSGRRADGVDLVTVGLFAYAALLAGRNLGPFGLVAAPVLSRHVAPILDRFGWIRRIRRIRPPGLIRGTVHVLIALSLLTVAGVRAYRTFQPEAIEEAMERDYPTEAVEWIREHRPPAEMFNPYNWGGYLIWSLWPEYRVYVDGRTDLYGDEFLYAYLNVEVGRGDVEQALEEHRINFILTSADSPLADRLACSNKWEVAYQDEKAQILVRRDPIQ